MKKYAMLIYPDFSLQEVTTLTSVLTVWFGEKIDYIASENKEYTSEEGLLVKPTRTVDEAKITDYDCVILPGTINPLPPLFDEKLIDFLRKGKDSNVVFASISSSPILLAKAGIEVLFFGNIISMIVYWVLHIWKPLCKENQKEEVLEVK